MSIQSRPPMRRTLVSSALLACLLASAAMASEPPAKQEAATKILSVPATPVAAQHASARLKSTSNSKVDGKLEFVTVPAGVRVTGELSGLQADSMHGFHIHAVGDCSSADGKSAGPHFNPQHAAHGRAGAGPHHLGDIPNQAANGQGLIHVDEIIHGVELGTASDTDLLGHAVIVHAKPDDYSSQPSGAAGARIACGVITAD